MALSTTSVAPHGRIGWQLENSYARLPEVFFAPARPARFRAPGLVILNHRLGAELGLALDELSPDAAANLFSGQVLPEGAVPIAQAYAGHQFGGFTMLGDGRAILLGEHRTPSNQLEDLHLKGAGQTRFSRRGDGRAALGPMLREYLISEAMAALGVLTTRSLAVVTTGEPVYRESALKGAVLTRVAASHIRVGTFEYLAAREDIPNCACWLITPLIATTPNCATRHAVVGIDARLYLPLVWAEDVDRCRAAGIPESVGYQPKWQLALAMIRRARANGLSGIILADSLFGSVTEFREQLAAAGCTVSVSRSTRLADQRDQRRRDSGCACSQ